MNSFSSLIPQQRKSKNKLMGWLNNTPAFHQLSANLAPIQNFVKRTTKGSHIPFYFGAHQQHQYASDDQTVDTTTTWEDKIRGTPDKELAAAARIKQTVVFVSRTTVPPSSSSTSYNTPIEQKEDKIVIEKRQRRSQQKNKVLMLLQLEQVAAERTAIRQKWRILKEEIVLEVFRSRISRRRTTTRLEKLREIDERLRRHRRVLLEQPPSLRLLLDLEDYYRRFDCCLDELQDRNEIMELEAFKQLVIREVEERAETKKAFRERLKVVHGQLMQKFIVDDLIQGGLYSKGPTRQRPRETLHDWIHISEDIQDQNQRRHTRLLQNPEEGSEWVVCDF